MGWESSFEHQQIGVSLSFISLSERHLQFFYQECIFLH